MDNFEPTGLFNNFHNSKLISLSFLLISLLGANPSELTCLRRQVRLNLIAITQSNKVTTNLGVQNFSQLRKDHGKEQANVIMNFISNIISVRYSKKQQNNYLKGPALCRLDQAIL